MTDQLYQSHQVKLIFYSLLYKAPTQYTRIDLNPTNSIIISAFVFLFEMQVVSRV